jgi:hypothetical protein
MIEIATLTGDEIVSDTNVMVSSHQRFREMGSDEPGAACHKVVSHSVEGNGKARSNEFLAVSRQARGIGVVYRRGRRLSSDRCPPSRTALLGLTRR